MNNNELYHYGVLGMKWGVRKGQSNGVVVTKSDKKLKRDISRLNRINNRTEKHKVVRDHLKRFDEYSKGVKNPIVKAINISHKPDLKYHDALYNKGKEKTNAILENFKKENITLKALEQEKYSPVIGVGYDFLVRYTNTKYTID